MKLFVFLFVVLFYIFDFVMLVIGLYFVLLLFVNSYFGFSFVLI